MSLRLAEFDAEVHRLLRNGIDVPDPLKFESFATLRYAICRSAKRSGRTARTRLTWLAGKGCVVMHFQFSHTHAYAGCRVTIVEVGDEAGDWVEFSDGVIVPCQYTRDGAAIVLTVPAYKTDRGTAIGEKTWILLPDAGTGVWKIKAGVPTDASPG